MGFVSAFHGSLFKKMLGQFYTFCVGSYDLHLLVRILLTHEIVWQLYNMI